MSNDVRFFAGVDWATETHQVCIVEAQAGKIIGERAFAHGGAGLAEMCDWLVSTSGEEPPTVAVAIEAPHGPVVEILLERRFQVDAVNPKQLDRFRDRFTVAGAKDDRRDAYVLADALRTDRHCFRRLTVEDPVVIELREWSRMAEDRQQERNRLANRVREQLWRYYPQALELGDDLAADWFLDLWALAPTPAKAARLRESRVAGLLKAHRIRRIDATEVLRILRQKPLVVAGGTVEAATAHITAVAENPDDARPTGRCRRNRRRRRWWRRSPAATPPPRIHDPLRLPVVRKLGETLEQKRQTSLRRLVVLFRGNDCWLSPQRLCSSHGGPTQDWLSSLRAA